MATTEHARMEKTALVQALEIKEEEKRIAQQELRRIKLQGDSNPAGSKNQEEDEGKGGDAASIPKDAKIAALEKNSAESEKMIAEARSDKIKQLEEMQGTQVC